MFKEIIITADTIEEALKEGCAQLNVQESEAEYEVLQMPEKKRFGLFGGSPAKVRVYVQQKTPAQLAADYVVQVSEKMGVEFPVAEVTESAEDYSVISVSGRNVKYIIGHRGDVLDSLEYLACLVANSGRDSYHRISLDVGDFRQKREETLTRLAGKLARNTIKTGKFTKLEPMNAFERKVIHNAIRDTDGIISWSEGKDSRRHVVIAAEGSERALRYIKSQQKYSQK